MAISKQALFEDEDIRLAGWAKALAHPARIAILRVLARRCNCVCGDITEELPLAQSTVSQHLKVLKESGLIQGEIDGVRVCYCINPQAAGLIHASLAAFTQHLSEQSPTGSCQL